MESDQQQSTLFRAPPEIRNEIYRFYASILEPDQWHDPDDLVEPSEEEGRHNFPSLILACKKLHREVDAILHEAVTVLFRLGLDRRVEIVDRSIVPFDLPRIRHLQLGVSFNHKKTYCALADFFRRYKTDFKELRTLHIHFPRDRPWNSIKFPTARFDFHMSQTLIHQSLRLCFNADSKCLESLKSITLSGSHSRTWIQSLEATIKDLLPDVAVLTDARAEAVPTTARTG